MSKNGLLIVTNLSKIALSLSKAKQYIAKTLYVQLFTNNKIPSPKYNKIISKIYSTSMENCENVDVRVILSNLKNPNFTKIKKPIDFLIFDHDLPVSQSNSFRNTYNDSSIITLDSNIFNETEFIIENDSESQFKLHDNVVLGGTFDRIHIGHKILLSEAVLKTKKRLVIGVTDVNMIKSKKLHELILPVEKRIENIQDFLTDIDETVTYEIVAIQDPFGPTKSDPNIQLIVVSSETLKGGQKVNELREQNKLNKLEIHCIDVIELNSDNKEKELKISSSNQRMDLLGTRIREPEYNANLSLQPYVIGLVGGIASGKSSICERLNKFGAKIIDCDKLAHTIYEPGEKCYNTLKNHFGNQIISDGRIDRKKLGAIVFSDKDKLEELNNIVWPILLKTVKQIIKESANYQLVIVEAAILIKAGWKNEFHEIWSCIIPADEAIKRLMARNNLSEEEARLRINSQMDNNTIVNNSNIVFSTFWSYEYSQIQVERAWKIVNEMLNKNKNKL